MANPGLPGNRKEQQCSARRRSSHWDSRHSRSRRRRSGHRRRGDIPQRHGTTPAGHSGPAAAGHAQHAGPGTAAHEDAEKAVTGADATKAQEAAVKAAGGGTAGDVTTDYFGNGYEVTVTQSDGTSVEYHLDSSFNVMSRPPGGPAGGPRAASTS